MTRESAMTIASAEPAQQEPAQQSYRPTPAWKLQGKRKPLPLWDRTKFLLLLALLFNVMVWNKYLEIQPNGNWVDAMEQVAALQRWILIVAIVEVVRQLHFRLSELSAGYHRLWTDKVFGRWNRFTERRFSAWTRFRVARVIKWIFWIAVIAIVVGEVTNEPPVIALFELPATIISALPFIFQLLFAVVFILIQFVALFWFLSRGGVETYYPDDIETRFSDVWGQDHVLARVKENIILLEKPEEIEARGGHVPSGILLWGPPGTGKTLMAEAVAGETGKPYVFVDPGAFTNMFFGIGILKVKSLFRKLRKLALRYDGVIVFFDEADVLGRRAGVTPTPAPGQGAVPAPAWNANGCNGFSHLSGRSRSVLAQSPSVVDDEVDDARRRSRFMMGGAMGGGGDMGTLQALLTELSGLKKPRGFVNRYVRRALGMRPKPPPKYRILVMMASNLPEALDPALLRPGRIDRIYRVGYPSKAGRIRTYEGYFAKVQHELTPEHMDKLATITPYTTGAKIKDLVNESLINCIRESREVITWKDVMKAKQLKDLGPPEDVEYIERERHAVAVHEACHAVMAWATRRHMEIDLATIEKGSTYLGMVASIPPDDQFTSWRSEYESDILVSLASLAGERLFFGGDNSSGVSGDLDTATMLTGLMEAHWGMGSGVSALPALQRLGINGGTPEDRRGRGGGIGFGAPLGPRKDEPTGGVLGQRIEQNLARLLEKAGELLAEHRSRVLALAHALESHKTLTGDDVIAILEGTKGPLVDGRPYQDPGFLAELERYHEAAVEAHQAHAPLDAPLPRTTPSGVLVGEVVEPSPALEPGAPPAAEVPAGAASADATPSGPPDDAESGTPPAGDRPSAGEPAATDRRPPVE
jgi:cell division protease FtsH